MYKTLLVAGATCLFLFSAAGMTFAQVAADPFDDGPYVVWHDSSRVTVFYICQGELVSQEYNVADTLRFTSLCGTDTSTFVVAKTAPPVEPDRFDHVPRILAVSDVHGEYEAFVDFLQKAGAISSDRHWSYGDGHLVINGDIVDRGDGVTESLWLVYRLEQEAKRAGGRVHFTLGNHEQMVLRGDNRYINKKYLEGTAKKSRILHQDLFGPDTELGRWLRTKQTMIRLNDILFVHAGTSPELVERGWDIETVNSKVRKYFDWSSAQVAFSEEPRFLYGSQGPLWYRGFFKPDDGKWVQLPEAEVLEILRCHGVSTIAVGHTLNGCVDSYYSGAIFGVGVEVKETGTLQGLLWEDGHFYRVTPAGERELLK